MASFAAVLLVGGGIVLIVGVLQWLKAKRIAGAPFAQTGQVQSEGARLAGSNGAISVEGDVDCPEPLVSPVTGTPCLYFELRVEGSWKDGEQTKSKEYLVEKRAAAFTVNDGTGAVAVRADKGGDFEPFERTFEETKKEGFFADLANAVGKGKPIQFGAFAFQNPPMSKADKFTCTEKVMKVTPRLFVLGKHDNGAIVAPGFRSLLLTHKTRTEVLGSSAKAAKFLSMGGGAALLIGSVFGVVANHNRPLAPATIAAPAATTTVEAAVAGDDPNAAASEDDCNKALDHLYAKVKLSASKRRKLVAECVRDMTKASATCIVEAQTIGELQKCQPPRKGRRSHGR